MRLALVLCMHAACESIWSLAGVARCQPTYKLTAYRAYKLKWWLGFTTYKQWLTPYDLLAWCLTFSPYVRWRFRGRVDTVGR